MLAPTKAAPSSTPTPLRPTLPRINTDITFKITDEVVQYYKTGVFADPRPKKTLLSQAEILGDGHKKLIAALREECQALYAQNSHLKYRTQKAEMRTVHLEVEAVNRRQDMKTHQQAFEILQAELEEANRSISEMDNLMTQSRTKRLNRLSQLGHDEQLNGMSFEN